ncbi:MAG: IS200/IS605 family element RNA-guided endonuclease TnpB [Anaerolineales bacterium]
MVVNQAFKFRLYPNAVQCQALACQFGCSRFVYNYFLQQRKDYYVAHKGEKKPGLNYNDTAKMLTALKQQPEYAWLQEVNSQALQVALRNLDTAYGNFFAGRAEFPKFKCRRDKQSFGVPQHFTLDAAQGWLTLPKLTPLKIVVHRPVDGTLKSVTISRTPSGRYFASILCEVEVKDRPLKRKGKEIGLDLGLKSFAVTSEGEKIDPPQPLRRAEKKLCRLQRQLSRKQKGSKNREKGRVKVARLHEKVANQRADFLHKQSRRLIDESQAIYVESLNVKGMLANHHLAKSISDAGWGEFLRQLQYKGAWCGCRLEAIEPFFPSSKRCTQCGYRKADLTLAEREWDCPECHTHHDRDVNAALNILCEGRARSEMKRRAGIARTQTPGETRARKVGLRTRKLPASAVG